jgi:glycosyltransferase involved in cell wall biosynthesis
MKKIIKKPLVSVILPVYNAGLYLAEAIESIIRQSYRNWQLIIIDDASNDNSLAIAQVFAKKYKRIEVFHNPLHCGVAQAANLAVKKAKGQLIARMDGDDVALPDRLLKQVAFLQQHAQVVAVGGQCQLINSQGKKIGKKTFPLDSQKIYEELMSRLPIQQPSMMVNRALLPKNFVWYHQNIPSGEEHQLLFRFFQYGEVRNLSETLLKYRLHGNNTSLQNPKRDFYHIFFSRVQAILNWGYRPSLKGLFLTLSQLIVVSF